MESSSKQDGELNEELEVQAASAGKQEVGSDSDSNDDSWNVDEFLEVEVMTDDNDVCPKRVESDDAEDHKGGQLRQMLTGGDDAGLFPIMHLAGCGSSSQQTFLNMAELRNKFFPLMAKLQPPPGAEMFRCDVCGKAFPKRIGLIRHIRNHRENAYKCELCPKSFSRRDHLETHRRIHTGEKPFACHICNKRFAQRASQLNHILTHTGGKSYECVICNKKFSRRDTLQLHYRVHTKEKPHKCDVCGKAFLRNENLTVHKRVHSGEKPYECDVCKERYSLRSTLKKHYRIHTGERPYKCDLCEKDFRQCVSLVRHKRTHHAATAAQKAAENNSKAEVLRPSRMDILNSLSLHAGNRDILNSLLLHPASADSLNSMSTFLDKAADIRNFVPSKVTEILGPE